MRLTSLTLLLALWAPAAHARIDPQSFRDLAFHQHPGAQLPVSIEVRDEGGRPATLGSVISDRPTIFVMEYLRCRNLCSLVLSGTTNALASANLAPGRQFNLVALSIDPRDTAADAAHARAMYAHRFPDAGAAARGLRFLTASPANVASIADTVGFPYRYDPQSGQYAHPAGFVVTTPAGRISRYILGLNPAPDVLKDAIAEAAQGDVTPAAHPLLLLCFGYDPDAGTAAALSWKLVRWTSFALVLACVALVALLSLRRRSA